jgi:signal transduction histidine kinase
MPTIVGFPALDLLLAAVLCLVAVASVLTNNPYEGPLYLTLSVAFVSTLALAFRRRLPFVAAAVVAIAGFIQSLVATAPGSVWSLAVLVIVMYSVAAFYPEGVAAIVGALFVGILLVDERIDNGPDYVFIVLMFGGTWVLGRASRVWRARVSRAEEHQNDLARLAVAEERVRIARELHDIVAHSLSVIAVQADAADGALDRDPTLAREPLRAINASARRSLGEIRELLQVLRTDDDELRPVAGLDAFDELMASGRRAGLTIDAKLDRSSTAIPPVMDFAAYRILQEALTNAAKHAGAVATRVSVVQSSSTIDLEVTNAAGTAPRRGPGAGVGLLGVRERVAAVGGTLEAGETDDGGFRLHAVLPLEGSPR